MGDENQDLDLNDDDAIKEEGLEDDDADFSDDTDSEDDSF